jgi:hypothetical protein
MTTRRFPGLARELIERQKAPLPTSGCHICGCTDSNACIEEVTGEPCSWIEEPTAGHPGLCSACV